MLDREKIYNCCNNSKGVITTAILGLAEATLQLFSQLGAMEGLSEYQIWFLVYISSFVFALPIMIVQRIHPWPKTSNLKRFYLLGGMLLMVASITSLNSALLYIPLGTEAALNFGGLTALTPLLSWAINKERLKWLDAAVILLDIVGIVLVTLPATTPSGDQTNQVYGYLLMFVSFPCRAVAYIAIRGLRKDCHWTLYVFYIDVFGLVISIPLMIALGSDWSADVAGDIAGLFFSGLITGCSIALGLVWEQAKIFVYIANIELVISYIYQVTVVHEAVSAIGISGAVIIFIACTLNGIYAWWTHMQESNDAGSDLVDGKTETVKLEDAMENNYDATKEEENK